MVTLYFDEVYVICHVIIVFRLMQCMFFPVQVAFFAVNTLRYFFDAPSLTPARFNFLQLQVLCCMAASPGKDAPH